MDRLHLHDDEFFTLGGRLDGSVQVGGTNVYPARIAALLALLPGVADSAVRLMRLSEGQRLEACVVPDAKFSAEAVRSELEVWIEQNLSASERPKELKLVTAIPQEWRDSTESLPESAAEINVIHSHDMLDGV